MVGFDDDCCLDGKIRTRISVLVRTTASSSDRPPWRKPGIMRAQDVRL